MLNPCIQRFDLYLQKWELVEYKLSETLQQLNFSLLCLGACVQLNSNSIYVFGGSFADQNEEKSAQSYIVQIEEKNEGDAHTIQFFNEYTLPFADSFWNPQVIVENKNLYCLQNVSHEQQIGAVYLDRKRILRFNPKSGWETN